MVQERVENACAFLEGKAQGWLKELREEMNRRAEALDFEEAARLRDICDALAKTIRKTRKFERHVPDLQVSKEDSLSSLAQILGTKGQVRVVECFDVSHVSGTIRGGLYGSICQRKGR